MSRKLLHKTQRIYLVFSMITFLVVAPLFYFLTEKLYIKDADETLLLRKADFLQNSILKLKGVDIPAWNRFNTDVKIVKNTGLKKDSLFYSSYINKAEQEGELYRELHAPITIDGNPYTFSTRINLVESEDLITSIALLFFILIILLFLGLLIITKKLSLSLWKPFYQTLQQIEHFEINKNIQPQLYTSNIEEFNRLNKSIEKLIMKNIAIYESQREFVENAAHELQTPISVFKGKIDLMIQRPDITEGQSVILEELNSSVDRLNRLNKNLLLLSKIDKNQWNETTRFSVKALIEKQLVFFIEQSLQKNIQIEGELKDDVSLNANIGLTEILFSNLFLNSIRHNIPNGNITIRLSDHKFTIANTGKPTALNAAKLFNRFVKSNPSGQGNGLGLAIVKKIADINNWRISYAFASNLHSFSIEF